MKISNTAAARFTIDVSDDQLVATLNILDGAAVTMAEISSRLREMELKNVDEKKIVVALERRGAAALSLDIARGVPAIDDKPGKPEFRVPVSQNEGVAIVPVDASQVIATITAGAKGTPGRDVLGKAIAPKATEPFVVGRNLYVDHGKIISVAAGNLGFRGGVLSVEPLLELQDSQDKPVNFDGDLIMKGGLGNGRVVRATGSLLVGGAVENADVRVKGAMQVKGGLIGSGRGRCLSGGDLWCRFITGSNLHVQGNVHVQGEVTNGKIVAFKAVNVPRGQVYGGRIIANGGVKCLTLGNESGAATHIEVGSEAALGLVASAAATEIDAHRARAKQVREKIEPLMKQLKQLTHQQREKATELLAEASEAEDKAEQMAAALNARLDELRAHEDATIVVQRMGHAGVKIRINGHTTEFTTAVRGPFTLSADTNESVTQIFLTDSASGKRTAMPTSPVQAANNAPVVLPAQRAQAGQPAAKATV